ncbi:alpha/beta hydrolase fold domain-containing protein [Microbacterium sp. SS28]|uniref:alpha/beta hydrolase fold domain-containing protein n=1 Tax=Microbacterium sp. SS28 TaxID=2919948 RepID=UPI001FAB1E5D|nr:alpha/beta hydrolase fold domain-containing protein [Microbacterium sp. SS28]
MADPYSAAEGLVRVYPAREPDGSGLVWAHGGGFAFGDLDMPEADWVARALATRGTTVVSVDYRLAPVPQDGPTRPEAPRRAPAPGGGSVGRATPDAASRAGSHYPAASDDLVSAWEWTLAAAARLRIDTARLAVGGASAGGNIVAGAVLRLLADDKPLPALVVLAYPTLLAVQPAPSPELRALLDARPEADGFGPDAVRGMYETYLGGPVEDAPLFAVPGTASVDDVAGFPPTLMINDDVDELRVSGEAFAATLAAAGREIEVVIEPGESHGHLNRSHEPAASVSIDRIRTRLAALSSSSAPRRHMAGAAAAHSLVAAGEPTTSLT